jgi:hypothetical protein
MNIIMGSLRRAAAFACFFVLSAIFSTSALAYSNSVTYSGQGLSSDGFGGYALNTELCGKANGADVDGPYLLFVLTASSAANADITGPWGTAQMTKAGNGSFKYISAWIEPNVVLISNITATYDGRSRNAQLTISHGCRPFVAGAWCSPGFWRNATAGAWALTGASPNDLFNTSVYDVWYGATFGANPTLQTVLNTPQVYSGAPLAGTSGYPLNAFNATGAYLTSKIPGFAFDFDVMTSGSSDACPIDHFGHFK